jgi:hypothetical protein
MIGSEARGPSEAARSTISGSTTLGSRRSRKAITSATSRDRSTCMGNVTRSSMGVSTGAGAITWTLMPSRATSAASDWAKALMPALEAE